MTEQELRQYRCCFTGHRPVKLDKPEAKVIEALKKEIRTAIADGFQTFISGMARGVDLWAAEIVLALRDEGGGDPAHLRQPISRFREPLEPVLAGAVSAGHGPGRPGAVHLPWIQP